MSDRKWVCDASPVILLAKVRRADFLLSLPNQLVIPEVVEREIASGPADSPAANWLEQNTSHLEHPNVSLSPDVAAWDLGTGESSVLSWALQRRSWTLVLDDLAGRRCAKDLGLSLTGTLGVVLLAKEDGLIDEVAPIVKALTDVGLWASDTLVGAVLREAGETPV